MSDTTFVDGQTVIPTEVMNDLNDLYYTTLGGVAGAGTITKVQFPAAQVASADANALDDYEESTFTPTVVGAGTAGTQTYVTQVGRCTKIGRMVQVSGYVEISAKGGTMAGEVNIGGFPHTASNVSTLRHGLSVTFYNSVNLSSGYAQVGLAMMPNETNARLIESGDNVAAQDVVVGGIGATFAINFSGCYFV